MAAVRTQAPAAPRPLKTGGTLCFSAADAYRKAVELMWNYDLDSAQQLLEPWRSSCVWHAGAYAECKALRVVLTGKRSEALSGLDLVQAAEVLSQASTGNSVAQEVFRAELLLLRSGLQVFLGARLRAVYNLRQCWCTYRRLERHLALDDSSWETSAVPRDLDDFDFFTTDDLRGRILFGLGFFYLATSLLPAGLCRIARLAGFVTHRRQGKAYLTDCAERCLGPRATLASIILATYHLDIEPDVCRAGELLVASLGQQPENVLLHWAGSLLAWRNTCIAQAMEMTSKALWCCGEELGSQAIYLRYELGMFHFMAMDWQQARHHLKFVHDKANSERIFFPYRTVVTTQLAAASFSMGLQEEGEEMCRESLQLTDPVNSSRLETDFAEVLQLFLLQRTAGRELLAFEVVYLMRQLPRVPPHMLKVMLESLEKSAQRAAASSDADRVEFTGAQVIRCIVLFYLGDLEQAMLFVPELSRLCERLPRWCAYISAHGLYWCGRMLSLSAHKDAAVHCLRQAKALKKYPFNISSKICKVLEELEAC